MNSLTECVNLATPPPHLATASATSDGDQQAKSQESIHRASLPGLFYRPMREFPDATNTL